MCNLICEADLRLLVLMATIATPLVVPPEASGTAQFSGSAQQSVEVCILRSFLESDELGLGGFLESDELGLGGSQALRLQQQISEIAVAPTTAQ